MNDEKIEIRVTSSGQKLQVVVLDKRLDMIQIVLGEGAHNVRCSLTPTKNGAAYVGNAMGREIVYEKSREAVKAELACAAGFQDFKRIAATTQASFAGGRASRTITTRQRWPVQ